MLVLGVHGGDKLDYEEDPIGYALHDSAAVLLKNGEVIAAIEEERLDRIKHSNCFPTQAIRFCLEQGACELRDLDLIATNRSAAHVGLAAKFRALQDSSYRGPSTANGLFSAPFQKVFGQDVTGKLFFCEHHLAHAWSAYALSGFEDCLLLSIDGDGDNGSGLLLTAQDGNIQRLREFSIPQSLGLLYENLIRIIGYGRFEEYKAMGLAPYGDPERFRSWFQDCYTLLPEGNYELKPIVNWFLRFDSAGLLKVARRRGEPFLQEHKDFAAALQACVETIVLHVLHHYQAETGQRKLCIAGGVGHNCSANGLILRSGLFQEVFVQPAAHDAGGALGAAICATRERSSLFKPHKLTHVYWGTDIPADDEVVKVLRNWGLMLTFTRQENIAQTAARLLAEGNVLGVLQGRSEFGPRALGNRSILADARPSENKARVNQLIKKREQYRPFAPVVLQENLREYFDVAQPDGALPFMTFVVPVRESARTLLGATTHIDGTARVQSVSRETNPALWNLINEFAKLTGVPVLLNTSFNNDAEPIVDSVDDAVCCYLTTGLDFLVLGDYLVSRRSKDELRSALLDCYPALRSSRKLVKKNLERIMYSIESTKSVYFERSPVAISAEIFHVLEHSDGRQSCRALFRKVGIPQAGSSALLSELMDLWSARVVTIRPPGLSENQALEPAVSAVRFPSSAN